MPRDPLSEVLLNMVHFCGVCSNKKTSVVYHKPPACKNVHREEGKGAWFTPCTCYACKQDKEKRRVYREESR